jgi:hypothetical protein
MRFTSHNTPDITLGNEQCLKLLLGVCNTKRSVKKEAADPNPGSAL